MPQSEPLFLTVLTPQNAMEKVENQIRQSDGQSDTSFVVLEEGDSLDYITENFSLRSFSNQFNARFKVEWVWTPDAKQMYQGSEVEISSLPGRSPGAVPAGAPDRRRQPGYAACYRQSYGG